MTFYFDDHAAKLRKLTAMIDLFDRDKLDEALQEIERGLVRDVSIVAALPGCPPEISRAINETVVREAVVALPMNAPERAYESTRAHIDQLHRLNGDLHTVFHQLANCRAKCDPAYFWFASWSDDPRAPLRAVESRSETAQEQLVPRHPFLVHFVSGDGPGLTCAADAPQRVLATRPNEAARAVATRLVHDQRARLRIFGERRDDDALEPQVAMLKGLGIDPDRYRSWHLMRWLDYDVVGDAGGFPEVIGVYDRPPEDASRLDAEVP